MKELYMVFKDVSAEIDYGVDEATYLLGIFESIDNAIECAAFEVSKSTSDLDVDKSGYLVDKETGLLLPGMSVEKDEDGYTDYGYADHYFKVRITKVPFGKFDEELFVGGAAYQE